MAFLSLVCASIIAILNELSSLYLILGLVILADDFAVLVEPLGKLVNDLGFIVAGKLAEFQAILTDQLAAVG